MSKASQDVRASRIGEITHRAWSRTRWNIGKGIDVALTNPLYRLSGWISEGRATSTEEDGEAMYQMGYSMGQQDITNPTRARMVEALEYCGHEATDENMAKLGFPNYPSARQAGAR